ncbi:MAG: cupin domain-containing protein [Chloroflexota bacterium]
MIVKNYFQTPSTLGPSHDGVGDVKNVRVLDADDFDTRLRFVIYCELKPGTSIGYHQHGENEEVYVVLSGRGMMTVNGETREVGPGDVILNKPRWSHGLSNHADEDLKILVFEVTA